MYIHVYIHVHNVHVAICTVCFDSLNYVCMYRTQVVKSMIILYEPLVVFHKSFGDDLNHN